MGVTDLIASLERIAPDAFETRHVRAVAEDVAAFDGHGKLHQILNIGEQTLKTLFLINFRELIDWLDLPPRDPSVLRRGIFVMDHKDRITRRKEREHKSRQAQAEAKLKREHSNAASGKAPPYTEFKPGFRFLDPPAEGMAPPPTKIDRTEAPRFGDDATYDARTGTDWVRYYGPWIDAQPHAKRALLEYFEACVKDSLVPPPGTLLTFDFAFGHAFHLHSDGRVEPIESARTARASSTWCTGCTACCASRRLRHATCGCAPTTPTLCRWWRSRACPRPGECGGASSVPKAGERHVRAVDLGRLYRVLAERYRIGPEQLVQMRALHGQDFAEKKNYTPNIGHEPQLMYMLEAFASPRPPRTLQQLVGYVQWRYKEDGGRNKAKKRSGETLCPCPGGGRVGRCTPQRAAVARGARGGRGRRAAPPPVLNRDRVPPRATWLKPPSAVALDDAAFLLGTGVRLSPTHPTPDEMQAINQGIYSFCVIHDGEGVCDLS